MKYLLTFFLFINVLTLLATEVSGIQTGTWTLEDSPFVVIGEVQIPAGEELTIEPGVTVQFWGEWSITAEGMLNAQGTETDSIYFDRYPTYSGYWDELRLEQETGDGYELAYCYIRGANNGVNSIDAPLHIHNSHLDGNMTGIHLFAIGNPDPPDVLIEDCFIERSYENGIDIYENGNTTIQNCEITNNGMGTQYRGAIQINIQTNGAVCSPTIQDNYIHDNNKQGITCTDMFSAGTINVLIQNNQIIGNLTGVYFYNCGGTLLDNQIADNFIPGDMNSGAGVMCYGSLATPMITGNTITGNYTALYITNGANPYMGNAASANPLEQGMNTFQENIDANGVNNSVYVYNCSNTYTILAENNTWDSEDYDEIAITIHDGEDSPSLPIVDFDPIYAPPSTLLSGTFTYNGGYEMVNWTMYLISVNNSLDIEPFTLEYGSFELTEIPAGYYFLGLMGMSADGEIATGTYGDWRFPEVLTINESSQYTDLEIEVNDYDFQRYNYVPRVIQTGDITLYHFIEGGFYPQYQALLYQDGDYLKYWGKPQYDDNGWYIDEFTAPHSVYQKITNLAVGDTWESLRLYGEDESYIYQYTVTARDTIEYISEAHECFTTEAVHEDDMILETFVNQIGITCRLSLNENNLLGLNSQLDLDNSILPQTEPSFLPITLDYFAYYPLYEEPLNPWDLKFAWGEDDQEILLWNPPDGNALFYTYRIYANDVMIAEIPVTERQFPVPLPIEITTDFYVTGFDGTSETEPSNTITWIVPTGDDNDQVPLNITQLSQNTPNPFSPDNSRSAVTRIAFNLAEDSPTSLAIYSCRGRKIKDLVNENLSAGNHEILWDGTTENGNPAASGIYFYKLNTAHTTISRKLLLLR
ncbi:MAG: right-handed parallel beta-helix repeat-containing protein [Candidatus Stygibacter australis]|nr:right-handed parallel beta-helix repeat-containing protein [Candidatus Stygibacter australis]MDP8322687.1 right-handed parallel beta-helix repeat-containing protein [Candidatus Stygibacter australis]